MKKTDPVNNRIERAKAKPFCIIKKSTGEYLITSDTKKRARFGTKRIAVVYLDLFGEFAGFKRNECKVSFREYDAELDL